MKSVSNAYKASMKAMLRNRSYVRITFGNVDTTAATDGEWESNGAASISEFETVDYAYQYGDNMGQVLLNLACSANNWWERSPNSDNTNNFCCVNSSGNASNYDASNSNGVSFGLCNFV